MTSLQLKLSDDDSEDPFSKLPPATKMFIPTVKPRQTKRKAPVQRMIKGAGLPPQEFLVDGVIMTIDRDIW